MLSPLVLLLQLALQLKISLLTSAPGLLVFVIYVYFLLILEAGTHFREAKLEKALGKVTMMRS